jgi:hypothetical protein
MLIVYFRGSVLRAETLTAEHAENAEVVIMLTFSHAEFLTKFHEEHVCLNR